VGNSSLGVNTPSSSGNVYFANEQTDRIIVPYRTASKGEGKQERNIVREEWERDTQCTAWEGLLSDIIPQ
jgi:hypothetical protein